MVYLSKALKKPSIRCLLFDLGDTLWYRENQEHWEQLESASNQQAATLLYQALPTALLPTTNDLPLGQQLRQAFDEQIRTMIQSKPFLEPSGCQAIQNVLHMWGLDGVDHALSETLFEALRVRIVFSRTLFTDTLTTLDELLRRGFLLGVVTNRLWGGELFFQDLAAIGLLNYFARPHIAISGDLGIRKPNPYIFQYVLQSLQVSPQETAMIGDSLSADIIGAQSLGIMAIWKPKPWLRTWALAQSTIPPTLTENQPRSLSLGTFPGIDTADAQIEERTAQPSMHLTDDDYILARADNGRDYLEQFKHGEIQPDYVIDQLADLLDIFSQVAAS